jgi:superfamily II DNA helicase RecQ
MEDQVKACQDKGIEAVMINSNVTPKDAASIYARLCPSLSTSLSSLGFPRAPDSARPTQIKLLCKYSLAVGTSLAREPTSLTQSVHVLADVTPEAVTGGPLRPYLKRLFDLKQLSLFAIDEAHCISSWGKLLHTFWPVCMHLMGCAHKGWESYVDRKVHTCSTRTT